LAFWGVQHISSGLAAVLNATLPFFVVIFAQVLTKDERITRMKSLGIIAAFIGVVVIFWHEMVQGPIMQLPLLGSLALVGSAASGGIGTVAAKKYASSIDPPATVLGQSIVGAITLSVLGIITEKGVILQLDLAVIVAVIYLGVVASALAFIGYYWLFTKTSATNSSLILFVQPIVALLLGWLILQERLEPVVAIGTILILSGVYVTVKQGPAAFS
jgi:drug/metabolite transporter (DMT)-like permease